MLTYKVRPISDRTWFGQAGHETSRFTATWDSTLELLEREITMLRGRDVVIEVDVPEAMIRNDGLLRANANVGHRAAVVAFESKHGPLVYRSDRFTRDVGGRVKMRADWQHNVRAIALTLEALRAIDRHGAAASGQQYTGWKALPSGSGTPASGMTADEAKEIILRAAGATAAPLNGADWSAVIRAALRATHPDRNGGHRAQWDLVEAAHAVLARSGALR